jgi:hypothetical protein
MENSDNNESKGRRGGYRGGGRPKTYRTRALSVRISEEAMEALERRTGNKAQFLDNLLREMPKCIDRDGHWTAGHAKQ